jgi:hypothetical protein
VSSTKAIIFTLICVCSKNSVGLPITANGLSSFAEMFRALSGRAAQSEKTYDFSALYICVRDHCIDEFWHTLRWR